MSLCPVCNGKLTNVGDMSDDGMEFCRDGHYTYAYSFGISRVILDADGSGQNSLTFTWHYSEKDEERKAREESINSFLLAAKISRCNSNTNSKDRVDERTLVGFGEWQSIELYTKPTKEWDYKVAPILVHDLEYGVVIARCLLVDMEDGEYAFQSTGRDGLALKSVTHWMRLPAPPSLD